MDADRFDNLTRTLAGDGVSRRTTLKALALGGLGSVGLGSLFGRFTDDAEAATCTGVCANRNWCVNRNHTCGPSGSFGKCLVKQLGGNVCAEILFQTQSCNDCKAPNCTNCGCILAAGGGDKCNNGATGFDYICVRNVPKPAGNARPAAADLGERPRGTPARTNPVLKHRPD
jgi:hypothetical protein